MVSLCVCVLKHIFQENTLLKKSLAIRLPPFPLAFTNHLSQCDGAAWCCQTDEGELLGAVKTDEGELFESGRMSSLRKWWQQQLGEQCTPIPPAFIPLQWLKGLWLLFTACLLIPADSTEGYCSVCSENSRIELWPKGTASYWLRAVKCSWVASVFYFFMRYEESLYYQQELIIPCAFWILNYCLKVLSRGFRILFWDILGSGGGSAQMGSVGKTQGSIPTSLDCLNN